MLINTKPEYWWCVMQERVRKTCIIILLLGTNKQYILKPARSSRKHVSSYLSFSLHLVLYYFGATHARPSTVQAASGQCGLENAICSHTITPTLAAVHARSCLFIGAWRRMLMLIDFLKAYPTAESWALQSYLPAHQRGLTHWAHTRLHPADVVVIMCQGETTVLLQITGCGENTPITALIVLHVQQSMWLDCALSHEALVLRLQKERWQRSDSAAAAVGGAPLRPAAGGMVAINAPWRPHTPHVQKDLGAWEEPHWSNSCQMLKVEHQLLAHFF